MQTIKALFYFEDLISREVIAKYFMDAFNKKDIELPTTVEDCHDLISDLMDTIPQLFK
jgi:hypothetical protein